MWNNTVPDGVKARITDGRVTPLAIQKDTVIVPPGGYVVVAFQANNPGFWFLHCHIEEHSIRGMAILLQEYPSSEHRVPPAGINEHGSFVLSIQDFNQLPDTTCQDIGRPATKDDNISIPKAGFGIMLVIIILLAIACVVLIIALVICCVKKPPGENQKQSYTGKEEVELSSAN